MERDEVTLFARKMEFKLRANDHKGGWSECSLLWLIAKLNEEVGELSKLVHQLHSPDGQFRGGDSTEAHQISMEAADVGNLAMMIADQAERILSENGD
jgi:NTP pyrophosphatase (non-canonical NTP hydrolase)